MITFAAFYEATRDLPSGEHDEEVLMTTDRLTADELLERLKRRMDSAEPGTHIRIDVIAWDDARD